MEKRKLKYGILQSYTANNLFIQLDGIKLVEKEKERGFSEEPLERLLNSRAMAKTLGFLLLYHGYDYSKTEIAREAGLDWKNLCTNIWPILEKYGLVKHTRTIGRAKMYQANMENPIMQALKKLQIEIAAYDNQKTLEKKEITITVQT